MKIKDLEKRYATSLRVKDYNRDDIALELGLVVAEARIRAGFTQEELARKIGTKQPSIARIENGSSLVSSLLLIKIAKALDIKLILPKFDFEIKVNVKTKNAESTITPVRAGLGFISNFLSRTGNQTGIFNF